MNDDVSWNELLKFAFTLVLPMGITLGPLVLMAWLERKDRS